MILLDTDILIDILRGFPPTLEWLGREKEDLGIPGLVAMELIQGCRNSVEQQRVERFFQRYPLYWPSQENCQRAFEDFTTYRLVANVGILDALVAHTAVGLGVKLATFNIKHYQVIASLTTLQPYQRS